MSYAMQRYFRIPMVPTVAFYTKDTLTKEMSKFHQLTDKITPSFLSKAVQYDLDKQAQELNEVIFSVKSIMRNLLDAHELTPKEAYTIQLDLGTKNETIVLFNKHMAAQNAAKK